MKDAKGKDEALRSLFDYVGADMIVSESVASAFGILVLADGNPREAIEMSVNFGGDTDTIAAITGSITGAWHSSSVLDIGTLSRVESINALNLLKTARSVGNSLKELTQ